MRIRLDTSTMVDELMLAFRERSDVVVSRIDDREIEAAVIGSYHDGGAPELERFVADWLRQRTERRRHLRST